MSIGSLTTATFSWPSHGGYGQPLLRHFGLPDDHVYEDVSANVNPNGPPPWVAHALKQRIEGLSHYPTPDYMPARHAIATQNGVQPEQVLLTNGGAEAIFLAAALFSGGRALILTPSFGEYARACHAYRLALSSYPLQAPHFGVEPASLFAQAEQADIVFICRPNNPTGTLISFDVIEALLAHTQSTGTHVVIDEAFIDLSLDEEALTPLLDRYPHLILLRSMTKFFTLPGLRIGYMMASADMVSRLAVCQPPWSVNHLASEMVLPLLADEAFAKKTRQWLISEQPRMHQALLALGLQVVPSRTCFFLIRPSEAQQQKGISSALLFKRLLARGMLVRHTHNFYGLSGHWLRLALRGSHINNRLLKVLNDSLC